MGMGTGEEPHKRNDEKGRDGINSNNGGLREDQWNETRQKQFLRYIWMTVREFRGLHFRLSQLGMTESV